MNPAIPQISASQFPDVYAALGILPGKLGNVMLNVAPIQVSEVILYDNLYYADPVEHPYIQGIVSETVPHVTLANGLMRSGIEMKQHVDGVLGGGALGLAPWMPEDPTISEISFFPSNDPSQQYITLIAKLVSSPNLVEANKRLNSLPHCDLFPEWQPHVTLAYLNASSDYQSYIQKLNNIYQDKTIKALDLNYGD